MTDLWAQERRRLYRHLRRRLNAQEAEDVVSEAFVRVHRRYGARATPELLWRVAFNAAADLQRAEEKQSELGGCAGFLNGVAIPGIDTAIIRADFLRAFRLLPRTQQEAFALTELRGLTERETAEVLAIPRQTVNWRCEAARTFLQKELR